MAVVGKAIDAGWEARDGLNVVSCRLPGVEAAQADVETQDGVVVDEQCLTVEGVEDGKAGPVENDGDDAVKTAFVSGGFVK